MILDEKHQQVAKEIIQRNRKKKSCNKCYDRGFIGFTTDKTIIPCEKCVEIEVAMEEWKRYVAGDEVLKEQFKELFEDDKTEETTSDDTLEPEAKTEESNQADSITPIDTEDSPPQSKKTKKETTEKSKTTRKSATGQNQKTNVPKPATKAAKTNTVRKTSARGK